MDESAVPSSPTTTCSLSTSEADFESDIEFPEDEQPCVSPGLCLRAHGIRLLD